MVKKAIEWLRSLDFTALVVAALFLSDLGTTGSVWASRQAHGKAWVGWVVALSLDASAALSLRALSQAQRLSLRLYAILAFLVACGIPASFGTMYYRMTTPADPLWFSTLLGSVAPGLGALLVGLRSLAGAHQAEAATAYQAAEAGAQRQATLELEKYRILQEEETARAVHIERTKQVRAEARATKGQIEAKRGQREAEQEQRNAKRQQAIANLGKSAPIFALYKDNPALTQEEAGQILGISRQSVSYHLAKLEKAELIRSNGRGIEVLA